MQKEQHGRQVRLELSVIEQRVCDIASEQLDIPRKIVLTSSRLIEDLHCDSLDIVELMMNLEDEFCVTIPNEPANPVGKSVFSRQPFLLGDLAEIVYLQQGTGTPQRMRSQRPKVQSPDKKALRFSQLSGRWQPESLNNRRPLFEHIESEKEIHQYRRRSDGMRCVLLPAADIIIGSDHPHTQLDEQPAHTVHLESFLIDTEPVSTTAYCRFLNSISATEQDLLAWFQLDTADDRTEQLQISLLDNQWQPIAGTEMLPMVLVSWFGANAYSLWANGLPWQNENTHHGFLPSEAQWEYAAQGAFDESTAKDVNEASFVFGQHERGKQYQANTMPMATVHSPVGVSSFGLHHMAGNVWQWCRDWYASDFYQRPASRIANPANEIETGIRSERGGSWVGPIELCRSTYRRGRSPQARGRCLGFRCISPTENLPQ